jgi:hypothetical protein
VSDPSPLPPPLPQSWPPARRPWSAWSEIRTDLRAALALCAALGVAGVPAGLLWWWLAPRADFRITADGPVPIGTPSGELLFADDAVLALILAGFGLLAGALVWRLRRRRGVAVLLALALGTALAAVVAWRLGELLGPGPTEAELSDVGGVVTTALHLGSPQALAVGSFAALLVYLAPVASSGDDLGRAEAPAPGGRPEPADAVAAPVPSPAPRS